MTSADHGPNSGNGYVKYTIVKPDGRRCPSFASRTKPRSRRPTPGVLPWGGCRCVRRGCGAGRRGTTQRRSMPCARRGTADMMGMVRIIHTYVHRCIWHDPSGHTERERWR